MIVHRLVTLQSIHNPSKGGLFNIGFANASTVEVYTGLSFNQVYSPTLTALYDVHLMDFTFEASASNSVDLNNRSTLILDVIGGYAAIAGTDDNFYLTLGGTYNHALGNNINAFGSLYGSLSSEPTFTDASFPTGLAPVITTNSTSAWIQIGLITGF